MEKKETGTPFPDSSFAILFHVSMKTCFKKNKETKDKRKNVL